MLGWDRLLGTLVMNWNFGHHGSGDKDLLNHFPFQPIFRHSILIPDFFNFWHSTAGWFEWIPSVGRMTELMDSLSSSDDRIGGFPQQVGCWNCQQVDSLSRSDDRIDGFPQQLWWQNRWIPSAGRMPLGSYLVNFGPFDLIFYPLWGFSVKIAYWNLS